MKNLNTYAEIMLAAIIWGSTGVFVKYLNLPPTTMTAFRLVVPTIILATYFAIKKKTLFAFNKNILLASVFNATRLIFYFIGFTLTSVGNAVIILFTWPIFSTIVSRIYLKEKISVKKYIIIFCAFIGIIITFINKKISFTNQDFIGMTSMLICAALTGIMLVLFKKELNKYTKFQAVYYQNIIGAIIFLPFLLFINKPFPSIEQIGIGSFYAILVGIIGYSMFFSGLKKIKTSTASTLAYMEVVSGIIFSTILLHEILTWNMILGATLILTAAIMITRKSNKRKVSNVLE